MLLSLETFKSSFQQRYRCTLSKPFIARTGEKGWERFFYCASYIWLETVALHLVRERVEQQVIVYGQTARVPDVPRDVIERWADGPMRDYGRTQWAAYDEDTQRDEDLRSIVESARHAIATHNGTLALWVIEARQHAPYERVWYESFTELP